VNDLSGGIERFLFDGIRLGVKCALDVSFQKCSALYKMLGAVHIQRGSVSSYYAPLLSLTIPKIFSLSRSVSYVDVVFSSNGSRM
jgi:hypothetical protein